MKKTFILAAALALTTAIAPAIASQNNSGCQGNCPVTNDPSGPVTATGGVGGHGGSGTGIGVGVGIAQAGAQAGAIANGGNASAAGGSASTGAIRNDNANLNSNTASNRNDIANSNTVSTLGINSSSNDISNAVQNTVGNSLGNVTAEGSSASTANANNSTVTVEGDEAQRRNPVSTAYAAPLVASADTCMGSSTAGAQGIGFGISIGSTWTDKNCVRLKNSRELVAMGYAPAAVQLLCTDKEVKAAMRAAGTPCK